MINGFFSISKNVCKTEGWKLYTAFIKFFVRGFSVNFLLEPLMSRKKGAKKGRMDERWAEFLCSQMDIIYYIFKWIKKDFFSFNKYNELHSLVKHKLIEYNSTFRIIFW